MLSFKDYQLIFENFKTVRRKYVEAGADADEVNSYLNRFRALSDANKLAGNAKNIDLVAKAYTFDEFKEWIEKVEKKETKTQVNRKKIEGDRIEIYKDDRLTVYVPLNKNAACNLGRKTDWCISKPNDSYFTQYFKEDGNVIAIALYNNDTNSPMFALVVGEPNELSNIEQTKGDIRSYYDAWSLLSLSIFDPKDNPLTEDQFLELLSNIYNDDKNNVTHGAEELLKVFDDILDGINDNYQLISKAQLETIDLNVMLDEVLKKSNFSEAFTSLWKAVTKAFGSSASDYASMFYSGRREVIWNKEKLIEAENHVLELMNESTKYGYYFSLDLNQLDNYIFLRREVIPMEDGYTEWDSYRILLYKLAKDTFLEIFESKDTKVASQLISSFLEVLEKSYSYDQEGTFEDDDGTELTKEILDDLPEWYHQANTSEILKNSKPNILGVMMKRINYNSIVSYEKERVKDLLQSLGAVVVTEESIKILESKTLGVHKWAKINGKIEYITNENLTHADWFDILQKNGTIKSVEQQDKLPKGEINIDYNKQKIYFEAHVPYLSNKKQFTPNEVVNKYKNLLGDKWEYIDLNAKEMNEQKTIEENFKTASRKYLDAGANSEDVRSYMDRFRALSNQNKLKGNDKNIDLIVKDKSFDQFKAWITQKEQEKTKTQIDRKKLPGNRLELGTIQNDDLETYQFTIPMDKEASCSIGKNTDWCTTKVNQLYFEKYIAQGDFLVYITKLEGEKRIPEAAIKLKVQHLDDPDMLFYFANMSIFDPQDNSISIEQLADRMVTSKAKIFSILNKIHNSSAIVNRLEVNQKEMKDSLGTITINTIKKLMGHGGELNKKEAWAGSTLGQHNRPYREHFQTLHTHMRYYLDKTLGKNTEQDMQFVTTLLYPITNDFVNDEDSYYVYRTEVLYFLTDRPEFLVNEQILGLFQVVIHKALNDGVISIPVWLKSMYGAFGSSEVSKVEEKIADMIYGDPSQPDNPYVQSIYTATLQNLENAHVGNVMKVISERSYRIKDQNEPGSRKFYARWPELEKRATKKLIDAYGEKPIAYKKLVTLAMIMTQYYFGTDQNWKYPQPVEDIFEWMYNELVSIRSNISNGFMNDKSISLNYLEDLEVNLLPDYLKKVLDILLRRS